MQTLQEVQKSLDNIGFNPNSKPFNRRILRILAITASAIVLQWIFLINAADNAKEYIESIYVVTTCTGTFNLYLYIHSPSFTFGYINNLYIRKSVHSCLYI